jgi:hypothetical protein
MPPEDGHLGPKHVSKLKAESKQEQFVALLTDCLVRKRFKIQQQFRRILTKF